MVKKSCLTKVSLTLWLRHPRSKINAIWKSDMVTAFKSTVANVTLMVLWQSTKESGWKTKSQEMASLSSAMAQSMMVLSKVIRSVELENMNGLKVTLMLVTSALERWMVTVSSTTRQERFLRGNSDKTSINTNLAIWIPFKTKKLTLSPKSVSWKNYTRTPPLLRSSNAWVYSKFIAMKNGKTLWPKLTKQVASLWWSGPPSATLTEIKQSKRLSQIWVSHKMTTKR